MQHGSYCIKQSPMYEYLDYASKECPVYRFYGISLALKQTDHTFKISRSHSIFYTVLKMGLKIHILLKLPHLIISLRETMCIVIMF